MFCSKHRGKQTLCGSILAVALATQMLSATVSADTYNVAYDSTNADTAASVYKDVTVEMERAETYTVTLPKNIVLDGTSESATMPYEVKAVGEIGTSHYVRIIPLDDAKLYSEDGTLALPLTVTQTKRRWTDTEVLDASGKNTSAGTMAVDNVTPGKWVGKVRFYVTLDDGGAWSPATCTTPAICTGYDTNDNGVIDDGELLSEPVTKGTALGHKFAEGSVAFPDTCERCNKLVFAISTPAQLSAFRDAVNSGKTFAGATVELNADIDMSGIVWDSGIGKAEGTNVNFAGIFDGNGHTIANLKIENTSNGSTYSYSRATGLFTAVKTAGVQICNLKLRDCNFRHTSNGSMYVGGLIGYMDNAATINNVHLYNVNVQAECTATNGTTVYVGGMYSATVGKYTIEISNSSVIDGTVYATGTNQTSIYAGGVVGYNYEAIPALVMHNCLISNYCSVGSARNISVRKVCYGSNYNFAGKLYNCVISDTTTETFVGTGTQSAEGAYEGCMSATLNQCKTQAAVDVLNQDSVHTWILDLESNNGGYPYVKN